MNYLKRENTHTLAQLHALIEAIENVTKNTHHTPTLRKSRLPHNG